MSNSILTIDEIKEKTSPVFMKDEYSFIDKVYLFGSYSRNEANEKSDVDFMIVLKSYDNVGLNFFGLYPDLEDALDKNVDVLTENECMNSFPKQIERDKILIYERKRA